jgi:ubiquinone/menaquinone biosynthesis C-methylase UbiE
MDEEFLKEVAAQLRKPNGELGAEVAEKMNEGNLEMNLKTLDWLSPEPGDTILELGMGNGYFVQQILNLATDLHYIGCDYSEDMIRMASKLNQQLITSGKAEFRHTTADCLSIPDHSVNLVFTVNTIYFWDDKEKVLSEFKRILSEKGRLIITFRPESCMLNYPTTKYDFEYFEIENVEELLRANGFIVKRSQEFIEKDDVEILGNNFKAAFSIVEAAIQ